MTAQDTIQTAAQNYWATDTSDRGHWSRGRQFTDARDALIAEGHKKGDAQKIIAEAVQEAAPPHEKKFGASTVSQYVSSFALLNEDTSNFASTRDNADLYAVVHKAYAGSMGVDNIRNILLVTSDKDEAIQAIASLTRNDSTEGDEDGKPRRTYGLKHALSALARIQEYQDEHGWTEEEKAQLFEAALATSVKVQPEQ